MKQIGDGHLTSSRKNVTDSKVYNWLLKRYAPSSKAVAGRFDVTDKKF